MIAGDLPLALARVTTSNSCGGVAPQKVKKERSHREQQQDVDQEAGGMEHEESGQPQKYQQKTYS